MITLSDLRSAQSLIQGIIVHTRLIEFNVGVPHVSPPLRDVGTFTSNDARHLLLKPENQQPIGAFKLRGAYNKIASLFQDERRRGVISYSSGNHAPAIKREATSKLGAEIVLVGPGSDERKAKAEELAAQHGYVIVPPYNDEKIIAGQGTIGLEILEDLPEVEAVFSPVGGGGLISGVAAAIKLTNPKVKVIGVEP